MFELYTLHAVNFTNSHATLVRELQVIMDGIKARSLELTLRIFETSSTTKDKKSERKK